jgi:predicted 2-oxoglutarate/Fe(II)-dependent dioxygenase YbiX
MNPSYPDPVRFLDIFDAGFCRAIRAAMDAGAGEPAEVLGVATGVNLEARRAASIEIDRAVLEAVEARLDELREPLAARCGHTLTSREGAGFLRYSPGGFYRPHRDRAQELEWPGAARRLVSVVLFLNSARERPGPDEFSGGDLVIYPASLHGDASESIRITPRQGLLVAFDSGLLHEVHPVTAGARDVVVDWYY